MILTASFFVVLKISKRVLSICRSVRMNELSHWSSTRSLSTNTPSCVVFISDLQRTSRCLSAFGNLSSLDVKDEHILINSFIPWFGSDLAYNIPGTNCVDSLFIKKPLLSFLSFHLRNPRLPYTFVLQIVTSCILTRWLFCFHFFPSFK